MDTIIALSSGLGRAAIAVVRISGPGVRFAFETIGVAALVPRRARRVVLSDPTCGAVIDEGLALFFPGPNSATGEDVLELHLHGSLAVVKRTLALFTAEPFRFRLAEPGEFSRRALENNKLDLLQVEGLGDVLAAETDAQLQQAQRQLAGALSVKVREWQDRLSVARAEIEAQLDFSDEGDVDGDGMARALAGVGVLRDDIAAELRRARLGQRLRDGFTVVIVGAPNVGKSSLINALAQRPVAIVNEAPGTTRDLLECPLVLDGLPVVLIDTAGLRETADAVEAEGVRRAIARAAEADLVLSLSCPGLDPVPTPAGEGRPVLQVTTKRDLYGAARTPLAVSAMTGEGLDAVRTAIREALLPTTEGESPLIARERQRAALADCLLALDRALAGGPEEGVAEDLRLASRHLARLAGQVDLETVLDRLFEGFCIGK